MCLPYRQAAGTPTCQLVIAEVQGLQVGWQGRVCGEPALHLAPTDDQGGQAGAFFPQRARQGARGIAVDAAGRVRGFAYNAAVAVWEEPEV